MTESDLAQLSERVRQNRAARQPAPTPDPPQASTVARVVAGVFFAGDAVLDVASGLYGVVTGAGLLDGLLRSDVRVTLADGRSVVRPAGGLLLRPTAPAGRP